jgi:hypothetical protein
VTRWIHAIADTLLLFIDPKGQINNTSFNWTNPYSTLRSPLMARNVVATSRPLASQAGLRA